MTALFARAVDDSAPRYFLPHPSFKGRQWLLPDLDEAQALRMAQAYGLPPLIAGLLTSRAVPFDAVEAFLNPRMRDFPDPHRLTAMEAAAQDVAAAIMRGEKIGILADFDVDGATSAAIMTRFLKAAGQEIVPLYIPDRLSEGYGPNTRAFDVLKSQGCTWVTVLDSGITSFGPLAHAASLGLHVLVVDHHEPEQTLPVATHIVNPKRYDDTSNYNMLAACGLTFLTCVAINGALRRAGYYQQTGRSEPPLKDHLDLVALGTICDMVPMTGPNRLFVKFGFQQMAARKNPGIDAILRVGKVTDLPEPYHAGFVLGPRINAGSRVHHSDLGAQLLSTDDVDEANRLAWLLDDCNTKRRAMQKEMVTHAAARVRAYGYDQDPVIVLDDPEWHPGLVGLAAGDLKERFGKPAFVIGYADVEGGGREGRGSGRSVTGINIASALIEARQQGLLIKGGGHAMAGGLTIDPDLIKPFREFMKVNIAAQASLLSPTPRVQVDGVFGVRALTLDLAKLVHGAVAPFGAGHTEPLFVLSNVQVMSADIIGQSHVRLNVRDKDGGPTLKAVAFKAADTPLGKFLLAEARDSVAPVHLAGHVQVNSWQGRESAEFHVTDATVGYVM